jgi:hypothetical protein
MILALLAKHQFILDAWYKKSPRFPRGLFYFPYKKTIAPRKNFRQTTQTEVGFATAQNGWYWAEP